MSCHLLQGIEGEVEDETTDKGSAESNKRLAQSIGWLLYSAHHFSSFVAGS
jgi:hypothetical protein